MRPEVEHTSCKTPRILFKMVNKGLLIFDLPSLLSKFGCPNLGVKVQIEAAIFRY